MTDALANLVGQQNARHGVIKVFNVLQEASANKHLLYVRTLAFLLRYFVLCKCNWGFFSLKVLMEMLLKEVCSELREEVENM